HSDCSYQDKEQTNHKTDITKSTSGAVAGSNTPFGCKQPQPVCEMPRGADNSHGVEGHRPGTLKFQLHLTESGSGMSQQVDAAEAQMPGMPSHVEEGDGASPALRGVHPVAKPGVIPNIGIPAIPNVETVKGVIQNGQPDPKEFESYDKRESGKQLNLFGIRVRTLGGEGVGNKMFDQKQPNRNNPAQRV